MRKKWIFVLSVLLLLSACTNNNLLGALAEPTPVPTDCGCTLEGPPRSTLQPSDGLSNPVGPGLSGGGGETVLESLESYRDRWETYSSLAYGLTFEYPAAYTSPSLQSCAVRSEPSPPEQVDYALNLGSQIVITAQEIGQGADLAEQVDAYRASSNSQQIQYAAQRERTVGGVPAINLPYRSTNPDQSGEITFFINEGTLYRVESLSPANASSPSACDIPALNLTEEDAYQRLLDSFQFQ